MNMQDLKDLLKKINSGDINAMHLLYEENKDELFTSCLKYSRNQEDAQDVLQDAFVSIFENCKKYKGKGSFKGWMRRIVINTAITKYKKERKFEIHYNDTQIKEIYTEDRFLSNLSLDELLKCIQELPDQYRLVFNLYELDGFKHHEIAKMAGISEGTSKSNLFRAKKILQKKIHEVNLLKNKNMYNAGK